MATSSIIHPDDHSNRLHIKQYFESRPDLDKSPCMISLTGLYVFAKTQLSLVLGRQHVLFSLELLIPAGCEEICGLPRLLLVRGNVCTACTTC